MRRVWARRYSGTGAPAKERIAEGAVGRLIGKLKETLGTLTGSDELAREGRLQEAAVETQAEAEQRAEEAERAEQAADAAADRIERSGRAEGATERAKAEELEREAQRAENLADALDPEER